MAEPGKGPGAYQLYVKEGSSVHYVGRADEDLKSRLDAENWGCPSCGINIGNRAWRNCETVKEAYETECQWYHKYPDLCNKIHPAAPDGTDYKCPVCGE